MQNAANPAAPTMTVEPLAQQHIEILRLADMPHLSNGSDLKIAPYCVWITYRRQAGASEYAWDANVSGYKVLVNDVVDMDAVNIHLWSETDRDITPDWLMALIKQFAPATW